MYVNFQIHKTSPSIDVHLLRIKINSAHSRYYYTSNYDDMYEHRSYFQIFR